MKSTAAALVLSSLALFPALSGEPSTRFAEPEVLKLGWNTRSPRCADFNGDGHPDMVLINQDHSRLEFLIQGATGVKSGKPEGTSRHDLWNPLLEVSRFEKQPLVVGSEVYSLAVGDFNGDGRADLAYTTEDKTLVLRFHGNTMADWNDKRELPLDSVVNDGDSVLAVDLNGDKRTDLALLTQTRLMVYTQGLKGDWSASRSYALTDAGCTGLQAADVDGDGLVDLFMTGADGSALLLRLQSAEGTFSREWRIGIQAAESAVKPVKQPNGIQLAWLQKTTGMVELAKLQATAKPDPTQAATLRQAIPPADSKAGTSLYSDITGDSIADVIIADPKQARVWIFAGRADGSFDEGKEYPSLSGVESMAVTDVEGDQKPELVLLSPLEKSIAIARWDGARLAYPQTIWQSEEPIVALTTGQPGAHSASPAILCVKDGKPKPTLLTLRWNPQTRAFTSTTTELPSPPSKISAIRVLDLDQDQLGDIVLFSPLAPMQMLLTRADDKHPFLKVEGLPDSLTQKLTPGAFAQVTLNGTSQLIVAHDQLARAFTVDPQGKAHMVEQFNAANANAQLSAVLVPPTADKAAPILLVDAKAHQLDELKPGTDGVYRLSSTRKLSDLPAEEVQFISHGKASSLLVLGKQSFEILPLAGGLTMNLELRATFASQLRDTHPEDFLAAPFTGRSTDDLMLVDSKASRVLEFFRHRETSPQDWQSFLYFPVFQSDPHYRGKTGFSNEPHDYATMDINADGKADLCLLVHDRLLLYVQP